MRAEELDPTFEFNKRPQSATRLGKNSTAENTKKFTFGTSKAEFPK